MKDMPNGPERMQKIVEMRAILERERPWIELSHTEAYALYHGWIRNVKPAGMSLPDRQVRRHRSAAAPRAARRVEPPDRVAGVGARGRVRAGS